MAKEIYRQNVWYWWMTNDDNIWQPWSSYDIEGIDVKKSTKSFSLWFNQPDTAEKIWLWNWNIVSIIKGNYPFDLYLNSDGYIYWFNSVAQWSLFKGNNSIVNWTLVKFVQTWVTNTTKYWLYIDTNKKLARWTFDPSASWINYDMWLCDSSINPNSTWASPWVTTWWAVNSTQVQHNTGNTSYLSIPLTVTNATKYRINVNISSISAWTCEVYMWWTSLWTLTTADQFKTSFYRTTASTSETLELRPTTDCNIKINEITICKSLVTEEYLSLPYEASWPMLQSLWDLYVWWYWLVMRINVSDNVWVIWETLILDPWYTVVAMTEIWDQVIVYASDWSMWKQYFWDWVSWQVDRVINWYDKPIQNVANLNNVDYVITGTTWKKQLFVASWYQPEKLYSSKYLAGSYNFIKFNFNANYTNAIETVENLIIIPDVDWNIYIYGSRIPGLPATIQRELNVNWTITAINATESNNWPEITVCFSSTSISWVRTQYVKKFIYYARNSYEREPEYNTNSVYWQEGILIMNPFLWDAAKYTEADKKQASKMRIGYKMPSTLTNDTMRRSYTKWWVETYYVDYKYRINIYETYNDNDDLSRYTTFYIGWYTTTPTVGSIYSYWSNRYTIESVTEITKTVGTLYKSAYIVTKETTLWGSTVPLAWWTITKFSWTWDTSILYKRVRKWKLIKSIIDTTKRSEAFLYSQQFYKIQHSIELIWDWLYTPFINTFDLVYDQIQNDLI